MQGVVVQIQIISDNATVFKSQDSCLVLKGDHMVIQFRWCALAGRILGKIGWNGKQVFKKADWNWKIVVYGIAYSFDWDGECIE